MRVDVENEVNRILPLIPKKPPENSIEILKKNGYLKDERLLYRIAYGNDGRPSGKMVKVHCSLCGGEALLEHVGAGECHRGYGTYGFIDPSDNSPVTSGDTCICPNCGKGMRALHIGSLKSRTEIDSRIYMSVHNVEGYLVLLSWVTKKMLHSDGSVTYWTNGYEGVIVIEKTLVRIKMYSKFMSSYSWSSNWTYTKRFTDEFGRFSKTEIIEASPIVVERTDCAHSALAEYLQCSEPLDPVHYIKLWLKHPNVENLVRQGFSRYLAAVIDKSYVYGSCSYSRSFDVKETDAFIKWSEVKPSAMLGLLKDEIPLARTLSFEALEFYRVMRDRRGIRLDADTLKRIYKYGYSQVKTMVLVPNYVDSVPLIHLINYLDKQRDILGRNDLIGVDYLNDYWRACNRLYGNVPAELAYPKNLIQAHDNFIAQVKEKESAELDAKIRGRLDELSKMVYQDEALGLMIRPAASQSELIKEGKELHHCVGGYATSHAEGRTSIFFIRKISDPDIPFYTLEYKGGKVNQNRGMQNCARTEDVQAFENKWLEHIKNLNKKTKENKNGKRNSSKERIRTGA